MEATRSCGQPCSQIAWNRTRRGMLSSSSLGTSSGHGDCHAAGTCQFLLVRRLAAADFPRKASQKGLRMRSVACKAFFLHRAMTRKLPTAFASTSSLTPPGKEMCLLHTINRSVQRRTLGRPGSKIRQRQVSNFSSLALGVAHTPCIVSGILTEERKKQTKRHGAPVIPLQTTTAGRRAGCHSTKISGFFLRAFRDHGQHSSQRAFLVLSRQ